MALIFPRLPFFNSIKLNFTKNLLFPTITLGKSSLAIIAAMKIRGRRYLRLILGNASGNVKLALLLSVSKRVKESLDTSRTTPMQL